MPLIPAQLQHATSHVSQSLSTAGRGCPVIVERVNTLDRMPHGLPRYETRYTAQPKSVGAPQDGVAIIPSPTVTGRADLDGQRVGGRRNRRGRLA